MRLKVGDTFQSPIWAIIIDGGNLDLGDGWTVTAQARNKAGVVKIDFNTTSTVLEGTADVEVDGQTVNTSTVRLYSPASVTEFLGPDAILYFDIQISKEGYGQMGEKFVATVVSGEITVVKDVSK